METGHLMVLAGPMFAGKSAMLIELIEATAAAGKVFEVWKPLIDTRQPGEVRSRNGRSVKAREVRTDTLIFPDSGTQCLFIDEAHMFSQDLFYQINRWRLRGIHVAVAGVDYNIKLRPFLTMSRLIHAADELVMLYARCKYCDRTAAYTKRLVDDDAEILVGDDIYTPICFDCLPSFPEETLTVKLSPKR